MNCGIQELKGKKKFILLGSICNNFFALKIGWE